MESSRSGGDQVELLPYEGDTRHHGSHGGHVEAGTGAAGGWKDTRIRKDKTSVDLYGKAGAQLPDVPTLDEGYKIVVRDRSESLGPKAMPEGIVAKLHGDIQEVHGDPTFIQIAQKFGISDAYRSPRNTRISTGHDG